VSLKLLRPWLIAAHIAKLSWTLDQPALADLLFHQRLSWLSKPMEASPNRWRQKNCNGYCHQDKI
jgi:hypothetical protein